MPDWLQILLNILGVVTPVATLLGLAYRYGGLVQLVSNLQKELQEIKAGCLRCQDSTRNEDSTLHGRITELGRSQAAIAATVREHGKRLDRLESKGGNQ